MKRRRGDTITMVVLVLLSAALACVWVVAYRWSHQGSDQRHQRSDYREQLERVELGHLESLGYKKLREYTSNGVRGWEDPSVKRIFACGECGDDILPRIDELAAATGWEPKPGYDSMPNARFYNNVSQLEVPIAAEVYLDPQNHEVQVVLVAIMPLNS